MALPPGPYRVKPAETMIVVRKDGVVIARFETIQGHTIEAVLSLDVPPTPEEAEAAQRITDARNRCVTTLITKYADRLDDVTDFINETEGDGGSEKHWLEYFFQDGEFMRDRLIEDFEESLS
jgi:hypothetical protein